MTDQELMEINVDGLDEAGAREVGIVLLREDIAGYRSSLRFLAPASAVSCAAMALTGMDNIVSYALMGVAAMFLRSLFDALQEIWKKKRLLKAFEGDTYGKGYAAFVRTCQKYVEKKKRSAKREKPKD